MTLTLTGIEAIEYAEANSLTLNKYADPTEDARTGLTVDEAREIAREDARLIWVEEVASTESGSEYTLSAPAMSGYVGAFGTLDTCREKAAQLLGVAVADMVEIESPDGGTTYCYASQAEAGEDQDGAYAVQYRSA